MAGPMQLLINDVEFVDDHGAEWSIGFEEILGATGRATLIVQDRDNSWVPPAHADIKIKIRSTGWTVYRGEILSTGFSLMPGEPWRRWKLNCIDYNDELPQRKVGAFDGTVWIDESSMGVFVNIDPYAETLATDKLTVQQLFDHYVRIRGEAVDTDTFVFQYIDDLDQIRWAYSDVKAALEEMAALVQTNLQFWLDPDLKFHWQAIPAWQDLLQDATVVGSDPASSITGLMFPEGTTNLSLAPYEVVDVGSNPDDGTIGFSELDIEYSGDTMPEQVYVKGGTGYVYNAPTTPTTTKTTVHSPTAGVKARYEVRFLATTKLWHKDSTGYVSTSYDTVGASGSWFSCKWVRVPWNEARNKGGNYWQLLEGPDSGKLVDDNTNTLSGYGEIKVREIVSTPGEPTVGVGGSGWTHEVTQDPDKRQAYLEAPVSTTVSKRDSLGGQALYRGDTPTLRGTVKVYGLDGWRAGQTLKITDARLPAELNGRYFVIQRVSGVLLAGNDLRKYTLDFGDGPQSRWSMQAKTGDITWPPPFAYIEIDVFDLSPGPSSVQRITGRMVSPDGTPWKIAGKTVNWSFKCYNSAGVEQTGQGTLEPTVSVTDKNGRAYTKLTTGSGTGLVYYVFANVKAE